jgi:BirA family transcriptional regulator, biotin operon repressor / biotin---[acetyl-CoA-carboxylase] ligase
LLRFGCVDSTMDVARRLPPSRSPQTVLASAQTAGRGRFERTWVSPDEGGLYLTVRIPWTRPLSQAPLVSIGAALALARVADELGCLDIVLKWPNDLLLGQRKAAGILAEMSPGEDSNALLVGVGINVSIPAAALSLVGQPAISLAEATGKALEQEAILASFLEHWSGIDQLLETTGFAPLAQEFRRRSDLAGRRFALSSGSGRTAVEVRDIKDDGSLEVQIVETGEIRCLFGGELLPSGLP